MRRAILITSVIAVFSAALISLPEARARRSQESQEDLRKTFDTIIVTPGKGPSLAAADFQPRAGGLDAAIGTFNDTLWGDLKFASVANLVGKSLYPKTLLADPASLKYEEWANDPVKSDYVAFGNLTGPNTAQGFLYDVKTQQQLLSASMSGEPQASATSDQRPSVSCRTRGSAASSATASRSATAVGAAGIPSTPEQSDPALWGPLEPSRRMTRSASVVAGCASSPIRGLPAGAAASCSGGRRRRAPVRCPRS